MLNAKWLYLALFLLIGAHNGGKLHVVSGEEQKSFEPFFPTLFYDTFLGAPVYPQRAKIVTEVIGGDFKRTNIEFINPDGGNAAFMRQNVQEGAGYEVLLSDQYLDKLFKYRPYTCESWSQDETRLEGLDYWSWTVKTEAANPARNTPARKLRLFGLGAMWIYAGESAKSYSPGDQVYSVSEDSYRLSHTWTAVDKELDLNIKFYFVTSATFTKSSKESENMMKQKSNNLNLQMVEISSRKDGKLLRTINVLSIEYDLSLSDYTSMLKVPVGYGCKVGARDESQDDVEKRLKDPESGFWHKYSFRASKIELEVTATKVDASSNQRSTDTVYAELAHISLDTAGVTKKNYELMMSKVKSRDEEIKKVENHLFNVRYQIDLQRSSCTMGHINQLGSNEKEQNEESILKLSFNNGLELALGKYELSTIFDSTDDQFTTYVAGQMVEDGNGKRTRNVFLEKTIPWPMGAKADSSKAARLIRTMTEEYTEEPAAQLTSVTIWVLDNPSQSRILEIYHINLIDLEPIYAWPHVPELFDVSQECYLDNENMHSGLDYAWVEFHFSLSSRQLDILAENEDAIKKYIYETMLVDNALTLSRMPRVELMFSDEGLVVRALLLDLPELPLMYESYENTAISPEEDKGGLASIAPDLRHCTKLCRQYDCKSMTFCKDTRCLLGMEIVKATGVASQDLKPDSQCITYSPLKAFEERMKSDEFRWPLKHLLGVLSHKEYDNLEVPQMPEELTLPPSESGLSDSEYDQAVEAYLVDVHKYLTDKGDKSPYILPMMLGREFLFLLPSRFVLEDDPLDGFGLTKEDDDIFFDANKVVSFFHVGEHMARFKFNAFQGELRDQSSLLSGLSYDQCALGCIDSKCGAFSYCAARKECILTSFDTTTQADELKLIESDHDCFVAQRDFAKNYQKYPDCERPKQFHSGLFKRTVSDCALACIRSTEPNCMSFEYCQPQADRADNCFMQLSRLPVELFSGPQESETKSSPNANATFGRAETGCHHYERSSLAEFNPIEARKVSADMLDQLKTTQFLSASTPMDCAEVCLNQLNDCSAFQFCFDSSSASTKTSQPSGSFKYSHSCLTIQSKPADGQQKSDFEALIDPKDHLLAKPNKYLEFDRHCHVYALRPDTIQAHLRDLAMGNTMSLTERSRLDEVNKSSGLRMSWPGIIFTFLLVAICAAMFGLGICYAREKNEYVRAKLDSLSFQVDRLRSRVHL